MGGWNNQKGWENSKKRGLDINGEGLENE